MTLADRMVAIYGEGYLSCNDGDARHVNPYRADSAEHHCWDHGWQECAWEFDDAIEQLATDPHACGFVVDGRGRRLAWTGVA